MSLNIIAIQPTIRKNVWCEIILNYYIDFVENYDSCIFFLAPTYAEFDNRSLDKQNIQFLKNSTCFCREMKLKILPESQGIY